MPDAEPADRSEEEQERLNRQMTELLNELRVAMPGVQVLFAFLLTVPFQQRFETVSPFQRDVYLVTLLAAALPGRRLHVVADAAYHGPALRVLPAKVTWTCRLPRTAVLYGLAPPRTGRRGRPRTKGERLGTPADLARQATWTTRRVVTYHGRTDIKHIATVRCLWYGSFRTQAVTVVLVRDEATTSGYDLALITTDDTAAAGPARIVSRYAMRWSVEQAVADARNVRGAGEARTRPRLAVERTVPFALLAHPLIGVWYARHG